MTTTWSLLLCCVVVLYLAYVFGLLYQFENNGINVLNDTYKAAFFVPFVLVIVFFSFLSDSIKEKNHKLICRFFKTTEKGIIALACYQKVHIDNKARNKNRRYKPTLLDTAEIAKPLLYVATV